MLIHSSFFILKIRNNDASLWSSLIKDSTLFCKIEQLLWAVFVFSLLLFVVFLKHLAEPCWAATNFAEIAIRSFFVINRYVSLLGIRVLIVL